jgi:hypothetical protein
MALFSWRYLAHAAARKGIPLRCPVKDRFWAHEQQLCSPEPTVNQLPVAGQSSRDGDARFEQILNRTAGTG